MRVVASLLGHRADLRIKVRFGGDEDRITRRGRGAYRGSEHVYYCLD